MSENPENERQESDLALIVAKSTDITPLADSEVSEPVVEIRVTPVKGKGRTEFRIQVIRHGEIIHQGRLDLDDVTKRIQFAKQVASRLADTPAHDTDAVDQLIIAAVGHELSRGDRDECQKEQLALPTHDYVVETEVVENIGIYHGVEQMKQLTNFVPKITNDQELVDDGTRGRVFTGEITTIYGKSKWEISAEAYSKDQELRTSLMIAGGSSVQIYCPMPELRNAISAISTPSIEAYTTQFGFSHFDAFATPNGFITASGFETHLPDRSRVLFGNEERARHLDLKNLSPERLSEVRTHVAGELCHLNDPRIVCMSLAFAWLPILYPFVNGYLKFALWIVGQTGTGKSFLAKLLQNLYGDFPMASGEFLSWTSTVGYLCRQGYYFNGALALIDDYKTETTRRNDVISILQGYADSAAKGRLNRDATTNTSRPFRGWILSTGEETPEQTPSALARTVIVPLPNATKNIVLGQRCLEMAPDYSGLTADFVKYVLANQLGPQFAQWASEHRALFYNAISGAQNDVRIASNYALLAASYRLVGGYFESHDNPLPVSTEDMIQLLSSKVAETSSMLATETPAQALLDSLATLLESHQVVLASLQKRGRQSSSSGATIIGRRVQGKQPGQGEIAEINLELALAKVNPFLQQQCRPPIQITSRALMDQLLSLGVLVHPKTHVPLASGAAGPMTVQATVNGSNRRVFCVPVTCFQ